jgi:TRAP-type mannitol/chloroaromatic compound transport system substrate-binding protein
VSVFWRAANGWGVEVGARNPRFKQILEHFEAYRGDQQAWFRVAEDSFAIAMAQLQQQPR